MIILRHFELTFNQLIVILEWKQLNPYDQNSIRLYLQRSLHHIKGSISENNFHNRYLDWQEEGNHIQKIIREYNWNYRKKICSRCSIENQRKLKCIKVDNFRWGIQETYCKKMTKARSQKLKKIILKYIDFNPSNNSL